MFGIANIVTFNILITGIGSYFIAPYIKHFGEKFNIIDIPNYRKVHTSPIVRLGGASIFLAFFIYLLFFNLFTSNSYLTEFNSYKLKICLLGSILFFLIGLHDDKYKSSPFLRLFLQFVVAFCVTSNGIELPNLFFDVTFFEWLPLPFSVNQVLTSFWIVSITNSINWLDGIDGLCSGFCAICTLGLLLIMLLSNNYEGAIFFSIFLGSICGFLIRNFKPAYYIMGDCGSNFLGFFLSTTSIIFLNEPNKNAISFLNLLVIFSLPLGDMSFVIVNRFIKNISLFKADRSHIHHRLLDLNFKYKDVIFALYLYSFITVSIGIGNLAKYMR